jgi:hypothetical protein
MELKIATRVEWREMMFDVEGDFDRTIAYPSSM